MISINYFNLATLPYSTLEQFQFDCWIRRIVLILRVSSLFSIFWSITRQMWRNWLDEEMTEISVNQYWFIVHTNSTWIMMSHNREQSSRWFNYQFGLVSFSHTSLWRRFEYVNVVINFFQRTRQVASVSLPWRLLIRILDYLEKSRTH